MEPVSHCHSACPRTSARSASPLVQAPQAYLCGPHYTTHQTIFRPRTFRQHTLPANHTSVASRPPFLSTVQFPVSLKQIYMDAVSSHTYNFMETVIYIQLS